ncbi:unnamed protein product [Oreochromis niloticus]|nr:unnamed protein product [Mustela putorius furo]
MEDIGVENMKGLADAFATSQSVEDFLLDPNIFIPLQATTVEESMKLVWSIFDYDGVVVELKNLKGLHIPFSRLNMAPFKMHQLKNSWHTIKKHFDLSKVSVEGLKVLRKVRGFDFAYLDRGFKLEAIVIPKSLVVVDRVCTMTDYLPRHTVDLVNGILTKFVELLKDLPLEELTRPTLQKTIIHNKGSMNVLPQDQTFVLSKLDEAKRMLPEHPTLEVRFFVYKFGQKEREPFELLTVANPDDVVRCSLHVACNLIPLDPHTTLFWSRAGLERMFGPRARFFTCMSMHECVNVQTELDQRPPDILRPLAEIATKPNVTFWQFYVDSPHTHYMSTFRHPISGLIVTGGLGHPNYVQAVATRAEDYYIHMMDLARKAAGNYNLRIEIVEGKEGKELEDLDLVSPWEFFNCKALYKCLRDFPLVVPFKREHEQPSVNEILSRCLKYMADQLRQLGEKHTGKGGFLPVWKAFQLELALEEALYGHPLSNMDRQYSAALGTSSLHEFSATNMRGFMGLGAATGAAIDDCPPPLAHWTRDTLQMKRIERLFALTLTLECEPSVLGPELVKLLLKDLFRRNDGIFISELQGEKCPENLKGHINLASLTENLATRDSFPTPFTFARARKLVEGEGKNVQECLRAGFLELKIRWFPDIKYRDIKGTRRASWNLMDYVEIHNDDREPSIESQAMAIVGDVAMEMERRGLCYARTLERYREHGMPWLPQVMKRIPGKTEKHTRNKVLVLVSSVGLIMNKDFVSYEKLKDLLLELKMTQAELQKYRILSTSVCEKVFGFTLYKLHYDILYRMGNPKPHTEKKLPPDLPLEMEEEDAPVLEEDEEPDLLQTRAVYMPAHTSRHWTQQEEGFINLDPTISTGVAYKEYVGQCKAARLPARSYKGFGRKRRDLLRNE